jgi:hypothetical protein
MRYEERCSKCNDILLDEFELDLGVCENCADKLYTKYQQRQEWDHYHPSDPFTTEEKEETS